MLKRMTRFDTDRDGRLSSQEFAAMQSQKAGRKGDQADPAAASRRFSKMDTDGDGFISQAEMQQSFANKLAKQGKKGRGDKGGQASFAGAK
jgi:Ca2+-binding EF-hand superfamily protein